LPPPRPPKVFPGRRRERTNAAAETTLLIDQVPDVTRHGRARPTLRAHVALARPDHWFKNVFVLPGMVVGATFDAGHVSSSVGVRAVLGLVAVCLVASSNYTLNELLDAPYDRLHPTKRARPAVAGAVHRGLGFAQWLALFACGAAVAAAASRSVLGVVALLWLMGCVYNAEPLRTKDVPYLDVLSEAVNNPLRLLVGWFVVSDATPPASLVLSYWMIGCYFMALKRFAELREIGDPRRAAAYRRSFAHYTQERLLVSVTFYAAAAMLFLGAFIMRYRMEMILGFPLLAWVMATYLELSFRPDSAVQKPEHLYREPRLLIAVTSCAVGLVLLLVIDLPQVNRLFCPTVPAITASCPPP
jgi:decaprenyl-phosphate phosphoribosyltransferase